MKAQHPSHTHDYIWIADAINCSLAHTERDQNPVFGIPSGFPSLDRLTKGWGEGDLVVIGGRPCSGNTALALSMARNAAVDFSVPTAYFSFGTPFLDLSDRLIVSESGIPMQKLHGASKMENEEWQRLESSLKKLSRSPLYLDCMPAGIQGECLLSEFKSKADRLAGETGVKLFFVDGFQATIPDWVQWEPDSLDHYSRKNLRLLKDFARFYGAVIVVLTNIGRPKGTRYPGPFLKDLDGYCPHAEDFADKIILLHRPALHGLVPDEERDALELRLVQNRNGRTGTAELLFDSERIRVVEPVDKGNVRYDSL